MTTLSDDPTDHEVDAYLDSLDLTCALCGEDSRGDAAINDKFYCHRDERSCYIGARFGKETP